MASKLGKYLSLDAERRRLLLEAGRMLGTTRLDLARKPLRQLTAGLNREPVLFLGTEPEKAMAEQVDCVGWAVTAAARHTPWRSSCLVQVLTAQRMLQARGIPGAIYIGAAAGPSEELPILEAHAWLKCGSRFVTGEVGHARYTVVAAFSWR
jgi:hypothetical protein